MITPDKTSAKGFERFVGGKQIVTSQGDAWKDITASIVTMPANGEAIALPSVSESSLAWTISGEIDFQERERKQPWVTHRITRGSFFLTSGGEPYECRWNAVTAEPFETMIVFLELPLLQRALEEVYKTDAPQARLRDVSAFNDLTLHSLMERLQGQLLSKSASALFVGGIAQAIASHLAHNFSEIPGDGRSGSSALSEFKLRQITDWMSEHLAEEFSLDKLAAQAELSRFYFNRLFKAATGVSPSRYHLTLQMEEAQRLLRETNRTVIEIALDVGYENPSHFARAFRRETGLTPSNYRQQR